MVIRHIDVDPTVTVEVMDHHPETIRGMITNTAGLRYVLERPVPEASVEPVLPLRIHRRVAVVATTLRVHTRLLDRRRPRHVHRDVEVEMPVAIEIEERGARPESDLAQARGFRDVREGRVAVVAQKHIGPDVSHVDIEVAVTVVVGDTRPHPVAGVTGSARLGRLGVPPAAVVEKELVRPGLADLGLRDSPPLHEVEIEIPVAVGVEPGPARPHLLDNEVLALARHMAEIHSPLGGDLHEPGSRNLCGIGTYLNGRLARRGRGLGIVRRTTRREEEGESEQHSGHGQVFPGSRVGSKSRPARPPEQLPQPHIVATGEPSGGVRCRTESDFSRK